MYVVCVVFAVVCFMCIKRVDIVLFNQRAVFVYSAVYLLNCDRELNAKHIGTSMHQALFLRHFNCQSAMFCILVEIC